MLDLSYLIQFQRLNKPVGIQAVRFDGWHNLVKDAAQKTKMLLEAPRSDVIAVIALLDLYGPTFYPSDKQSVVDRYSWAKQNLEQKVNNPKFRQFFAVHETEAWLLSDSEVFPAEIQTSVRSIKKPETVNFNKPPAKVLEDLYMQKYKRHYGKVTDGSNLFAKLDPSVAVKKCPYLEALLNELLELAQDAGQ